MRTFKDKVILITGGASGIGKIMSRLCLERSAEVIIWDINPTSLNQTITQLSKIGKVQGYIVDVSMITSIKEASTKVKEKYKRIDLLINNAGIVIGKYFHSHSTSDIIKTMEINSIAPMIITQEFLQEMMNENSGHICNIASSGGLLSNPKMSVYASSKWSLIGWSDSLRLEMKQLQKDIQVTTIMPYYINTGMFDGVKSRIPILDQESASFTIINAIEKNKKMVTIPGYIYKVTRFGQAVMSIDFFDWFTGSIMGIYKTMEHFVGRQKQ